MIPHGKFGLLAVGLIALPIAASAQTRTAPIHPAWHPAPVARPLPARVSPPTHPMIVRVPVASTTHRVETSAAATNTASNVSVFPNGNTAFIPATATSFDLNQLLNNVPGLGFDYSHVAALNGNLGERAFIDPVTQQDIALSEQLARSAPAITGGFIPFWGGFGYSEPVVEEQQPQSPAQPQVIILQVPAASSAASVPSASQSAAASEPTPLPDIGEFTLVLRNGEKIKAVAFTRQNDQIVYITSDGQRNSFPVADLDATATEQLNQGHGTPLHLSF